MKRILVVLLFVAVASVGFSVTGQVYTELRSTATGNVFYTQESWSLGSETPLDDQRCGRQGTGVDINFDTFTFTWKMRDVLTGTGPTAASTTATTNVSTLNGLAQTNVTTSTSSAVAASGVQGLDKLAGPGQTLTASSPGYFYWSGMKAGDTSFAVGFAWWTTLMSGASTNIATGTTNSTIYNLFAFDFNYSIPAGDITIHGDPWNKGEICFYTGLNNMVTGNVYSVSNSVGGFGARIPLYVTYSSGPIGLEFRGQYFGDAQGWTGIGSGGFYSDNQIGVLAAFNYTINDLWGVWVDLGIVYIGGGCVSSNAPGAITTNSYGGLVFPLTFGLKFSPAPVWTMNIGYGFYIPVALTSIAGSATNTYGIVPDTTCDNFSINGYEHPFINLGADVKFAEDWTAGLRFIVYIDNAGTGPGAGCGEVYPYLGNIGSGGTGGFGGGLNTNLAGNSTYSIQNNWLYFNNEGDWDNFGGSACYIGYSKDNFSVKLWTAASTTDTGYSGTTSSGLLGLFGAIDVALKF